MITKTQIKQQLLRATAKEFGLKDIYSVDPVIRLLIEAFSSLWEDNAHSIADIKERLLGQLAATLTPDHLLGAKPSHSVMRATPVEPTLNIDRKTVFYSNHPTNAAQKFNLKELNFVPVIDHIKLIKGEITSFICERNVYNVTNSEKELVTRASSFTQECNRTIWIGLTLDKQVSSLTNTHFYLDFPNTPFRHELYDILSQTKWSINGIPLKMETGIWQPPVLETDANLSGGIFAHYNLLQMNDEEIESLYRKQFRYIKDTIRTTSLQQAAFPAELLPFFPDRVKAFDPQHWIKIVFPAYFKTEDLEDLSIHLNAFPVSNKNLRTHMLYRNKNMTDILPLPVDLGEYFLAVEEVEDSYGNAYTFLPYKGSAQKSGSYTIKRGGLERFSVSSLQDMLDRFLNLLRNEFAAFTAMQVDNIGEYIDQIDSIINGIKYKLDIIHPKAVETPTYLLLDSVDQKPENKADNNITASYWTTNGLLGEGMPYGALFDSLKTALIESESCYLLKASAGAKTTAQKDELSQAYKYALTTRDQLFSARDIENYCYLRFSNRVQQVQVTRGIICGKKEKEGLIRTINVQLHPTLESYQQFDSATLGALKTELEERSPEMYQYQVFLDPTSLEASSTHQFI